MKPAPRVEVGEAAIAGVRGGTIITTTTLIVITATAVAAAGGEQEWVVGISIPIVLTCISGST